MSLGTDQQPCVFPPHPGDAGDGTSGLAADWARSRSRGWLAHAPAERVPLAAIPAVWAAAGVLHLAGVPGLYPGAAAVAAAGLAFGLGEARARKPERIRVPGSKQERVRQRLRGAELAAATAIAGAWVTAAAVLGPLAGPYHLLTVIYALGALIGYWWLRRHEAVRAAREARDGAARWVERKADWHRLSAHLPGLRGSHLLEEQETLLGETRLIDTIGTGKLASQLPYAAIAERLAEIDQVPMGRIDVAPDAQMAGKLWITTRRTDPWAKRRPRDRRPARAAAVGQQRREGRPDRREPGGGQVDAARHPHRADHSLPGCAAAADQPVQGPGGLLVGAARGGERPGRRRRPRAGHPAIRGRCDQ